MTSLDEQIGSNLARLRGDLSQRDLAVEMTRRGWKWSHVTVGSVERGERPLRAAEALGVANILGIQVEDLVTAQDNVRLREAQRSVIYQLDRLQTAVRAWDAARVELAVVADDVGHESDPDALTVDGMGLVGLSAEVVVRDIHAQESFASSKKYWLSRSSGAWMKSFIEAEKSHRGKR